VCVCVVSFHICSFLLSNLSDGLFCPSLDNMYNIDDRKKNI
jgi:hypothetical protein